jgi:hypothetical protein
MTDGSPGACHKCFRTRAQAEAFIEDWKTTYANLMHEKMKRKLDAGYRPVDMKMDLSNLLKPNSSDKASEDATIKVERMLVIDESLRPGIEETQGIHTSTDI